MKIDEKLELLARAIRGDIKIEVKGDYNINQLNWNQLSWLDNPKMFVINDTFFTVNDLMRNYFEIREVKKLPLLTQDECEFLKWFPQDWWIAKDEDNLIGIYEIKPAKDESCWESWNGDDVYMTYHPLFESIKWSDEDCYTIGELIKYSKENS